MTISQTQLVDILYKKLSGVSKTDTSTAKSPANEANASPQLSPGSTVWQQDYYIPNVTTLPASNSSVVTVYRDSLSSTVQASALSESTAQETWATNLTDWISPQFGAGYQLQLYAGPPGKSNPQSLVNLPVGGSGNSDSWYFDYSAGIVNFADTNVPTPVANVANVVYVVGARYTGVKGIANFANLNIGTISINGNTITGNTGVTFGGNVSSNYFVGTLVGNVLGNISGSQTLTNLTVTGNTATGNLLTNNFFYANGAPVVFSNYGNANVAVFLASFGSNTISTAGNITAGNVIAKFYGNVYTDYISGQTGNVVTFLGTGALQVPIGGNTARPASPASGQIRYNSDYNTVEFYNGTSWISVISEINDQIINGDGATNTFTLNQGTTTSGILVSINGTVQQPITSYNVTGNQITFTETPLSSDVIDVRFLAVSIVKDNIFDNDIVVNGNVIPGANVTYNLGSPTQQWKSLYVSSNTIYFGGTALSVAGNTLSLGGAPIATYSNANVATYLAAGTDATISAINANVTAANLAITTANSYNQTYTTTSISAINANVTAANLAIATANSYNQTYTSTSINTAINNLIGSAPGTLATLGQIAANLATDANSINAIISSITSVNANVTAANATIATLAPVASPALTGIPTAPTANISANNTQLATTAFVHNMLPTGIIMMWSGSSTTIPYGWYLCNGSNGTPDLRDRFIVGAGNTYAVGDTGGSKDAIVVSHSHGISDPGHAHNFGTASYELSSGAFILSGQLSAPGYGGYDLTQTVPLSGGSYTTTRPVYNTGSASTGISVNSAGSSGTNANLPPYYSLCYIMKA